MCEEHKHLPRVKTAYSDKDYGTEIQEMSNKKLEKAGNLKKEIVDLFSSMNHIRSQLAKPKAKIPNIKGKTDKELLMLFSKLKEENKKLGQELINQEQLKNNKRIKTIAPISEVLSQDENIDAIVDINAPKSKKRMSRLKTRLKNNF